MKKIILLFLLLSCFSKRSLGAEKWNYELFLSVGDSEQDIILKLGNPTEKLPFVENKLSTQYYRYKDQGNKHFADFLIDTDSKKVLEKNYSPRKETDQYYLKKLKQKYLPNVTLENVSIPCKHHDEIVLVNKKMGILIRTDNSNEPIVDTIAYLNADRFNSNVEKIKNRKCRYP